MSESNNTSISQCKKIITKKIIKNASDDAEIDDDKDIVCDITKTENTSSVIISLQEVITIEEGDTKIHYLRDNAKVPRHHLRDYIMKSRYGKFTWQGGVCEFDEDYIKIRTYVPKKYKYEKSGYTERFMPGTDEAWSIIIKKLSNKKISVFVFYKTDEWDSDDSGYDSDCTAICYSLDTIYYFPQNNYFLSQEKYNSYTMSFEKAAKINDNAEITKILDILCTVGINKRARFIVNDRMPYTRDINFFMDNSVFKLIENKEIRDRAVKTFYPGYVLNI
jgi:hypothetical protein